MCKRRPSGLLFLCLKQACADACEPVYPVTINALEATPSPASRLLQIEMSHTIEDTGPRQPSRGGSNRPTLATRWRIGRTHACRTMENWTDPRLPHDEKLDGPTLAARWRIGPIHACRTMENWTNPRLPHDGELDGFTPAYGDQIVGARLPAKAFRQLWVYR